MQKNIFSSRFQDDQFSAEATNFLPSVSARTQQINAIIDG